MTKTDCGICGYHQATHYHETDTVHDSGQGEFTCCGCDHGTSECDN